MEAGHLGGAAFDVVTAEPPPLDHPFMQCKHPNFILTPHIAWGNLESRQQLIQETALNIQAFLAGKGRSLVTGSFDIFSEHASRRCESPSE